MIEKEFEIWWGLWKAIKCRRAKGSVQLCVRSQGQLLNLGLDDGGRGHYPRLNIRKDRR